MLACQSWETTGVSNKKHRLHSIKPEPLWLITSVLFLPNVTRQDVCCERGGLDQTRKVLVSVLPHISAAPHDKCLFFSFVLADDVYRRKRSEREYEQKIADGLIVLQEPSAKWTTASVNEDLDLETSTDIDRHHQTVVARLRRAGWTL